MDMEKKIKALFDFQRFQENEKLKELIHTVGNSVKTLNLDELAFVNAAGNGFEEKAEATPVEMDYLRKKQGLR